MILLRVLIILISTVLIFSTDESFAASGSSVTASGNTTVKVKSTEKIDTEKKDNGNSETNTEEKKIEDKKTETNAQKIILEVYKIQGNKILKDMGTSIEKVNPDPKVRIEIYSSIQKTLEFRKLKLEKSDLSDESKDILTGYIEYMIAAIEKKKKSLE